jgi:hypothetical protein
MTPADSAFIPDAPWSRPRQESLEALSVTAAEGLGVQEAKERRR